MPSEAQQLIPAAEAVPAVSERYFPTPSDLLEMSLHNFEDHARELLAKHNQMTGPQRAELASIVKELEQVIHAD